MRSLIKGVLIGLLLVMAGYIYKIYYIDHSSLDFVFNKIVPQVQAAESSVEQQVYNPVVVNQPVLGGQISPIFTREVQYWSGNIQNWSTLYGVDKNLIATVMQIESCGDPQAVSGSGAMGLFQVMPFHFNALENPYDPETNALRGVTYLNSSLGNAGGDTRLALAGYNGGIGVISRGEWTWAAETARYVKYGYPIYVDAALGLATSTALDDWYGKYGAGLCRQAANRLGIQ